MDDLEAAERTLVIIWAVHDMGDPYMKEDMGTDEEIEAMYVYWEKETERLRRLHEAVRYRKHAMSEELNSIAKIDRQIEELTSRYVNSDMSADTFRKRRARLVEKRDQMVRVYKRKVMGNEEK